MTRKRTPLSGLAFGLAVLSGVLLGLFISKSGALNFNGDVSAGNIFQACATIGSAWIVTLYLQKAVHDDRKQKELLLQQFDLLLSLLGEFEEIHSESELLKVNNLLKKISLKSVFIAKCMEDCGCPKEILRDSDLSSLIKDLRLATTDTPTNKLKEFAGGKSCPAYVKEGIINWDSGRRTEIDMVIESLKAAIFGAQLKVNRA